ncbi:hypothetical protein AMJ85_02790 [candidate division BRC1 bacterium SM23_51]|nr:MAG: hypothetical protein AMJ85_02790 [candidate division BRC1 bacterium SM23_51]
MARDLRSRSNSPKTFMVDLAPTSPLRFCSTGQSRQRSLRGYNFSEALGGQEPNGRACEAKSYLDMWRGFAGN